MIRTLERDERRTCASKQRAAGVGRRMAALAKRQARGLAPYPEHVRAVHKSDLPSARYNADQLGRGARDTHRVPMGSERAQGTHLHQAVRRVGHGPTRFEAKQAGIR